MIADRVNFYRAIEARRGRPLVAFATSTRPGYQVNIAADVLPEIDAQLDRIANVDAVDLLLITAGGDIATALRIVSAIRERVRRFSVLIPGVATSAGTIIASGADSIVMHAAACLGPVDPYFSGQSPAVGFGAEDVRAFLQLAGPSGMKELTAAVGPVTLGAAIRTAKHLPRDVAKLLRHQLCGPLAWWKARCIARKLTAGYGSHCIRLGRADAVSLGLNVEAQDSALESLLAAIADDFAQEFKTREAWNPVQLVAENDGCRSLFESTPAPVFPLDGIDAVLSNQRKTLDGVLTIPSTPYKLLAAAVESVRLVSHNVTEGLIFASRKPDLTVTTSTMQTKSGWATMPLVVEAQSARRVA